MDRRVGESIKRLLALPESDARSELLRASMEELGENEIDQLAEGLMEKVIQLQMEDTQLAMQVSVLILNLADLTRKPQHRALGLRAKAQTLVIGLGEYQQALPIYDEALAIYRDLGDEVSQARVQVTRIWALASLGRYSEAIATGEKAGEVLKTHRQWRSLAKLKNNLAMIHRRADEPAKALVMLDDTRAAYRRLGSSGKGYLAITELNRALLLYELGDFETSLEASQAALDLAEKFNQTAIAAIAYHNLGMTYFRLGRSNEALQLFDQARENYLELGQRHNAALCTLASLDCLLELGRFKEILEMCKTIMDIFTELGMLQEAAETLIYQAQVYSRLRQYKPAIGSYTEARRLFETLNNRRYIAITDLSIADLKYLQNQHEDSFAIAKSCIQMLDTLGLPFEKAQAQLLAARSAAGLGDTDSAYHYSRSALALAKEIALPFLAFQGYHILGQLSEVWGEYEQAHIEYLLAIETLERLRGNVMVEFQSTFVEDKVALYEDMVRLCLKLNRVEQGLQYAERAKSRALLNILAKRLQMGVHSLRKADRPLAEEIMRLKQERDRLLWKGELGLNERHVPDPDEQLRIQQHVHRIEERITELWHKLLVRDADYAREADLWGVVPEVELPSLPDDTLLAEYYAIAGELVVFLVSGESERKGDKVKVLRLPLSIAQTQSLLQRLGLNLRLVPASPDQRMAELVANAQSILHQLYGALLGSLTAELSKHQKLVIVPHGPLHYLPFHALYDGRQYLLERYQVSYLPGISFLDYIRPEKDMGEGALTVGHSRQGELPNTILEANLVAELFGGETLLEGSACREPLLELAPGARMLHFACHGEFRPDNPLFSGLELADGWLTTLDVFNLRLQASLVTLSACQTGRSVIGGGDELLGLQRAFLAAGAASLVMSHWLVEDRSTAMLMKTFYQQLAGGETKAEALRTAQLNLLLENGQPITHPYFWAPFFLTGHTGHL
jgi:CHAT domain-containing protein/tetratricopeptide (TPR) repeat protein